MVLARWRLKAESKKLRTVPLPSQLATAGLFYAALRKYDIKCAKVYGYEGAIVHSIDGNYKRLLLQPGFQRDEIERGSLKKIKWDDEDLDDIVLDDGKVLQLAKSTKKEFDASWYQSNLSRLPEEYKS